MKYLISFLTPLFFTLFLFTAYLALVSDKETKAVEAKLSEDGVQRVGVIVDSNSFDPNQIIVIANKPVEITLKSVASVIHHNFTLNYPDAGLNIDQDISPGEDVKVTFTPTKTGNFEFYCDKKGLFGSHQKKGMKGTLEVE